jgi:type II secretory pathway pseudopilin PulG
MKMMRGKNGRRGGGDGAWGLTLVEMVVALLVLTLISGAIFKLLLGAANTQRYTQSQSTALWETDFAWHRMTANGMAAVPSASAGMTPTVSTDSNGQSRLTFIVPDVANSTTRTLIYYCTGSAAPYTLVESDPRYNASGVPNAIVHNVSGFLVTLDVTTTMKIWVTLTVAPTQGWPLKRHFCVQGRDF